MECSRISQALEDWPVQRADPVAASGLARSGRRPACIRAAVRKTGCRYNYRAADPVAASGLALPDRRPACIRAAVRKTGCRYNYRAAGSEAPAA